MLATDRYLHRRIMTKDHDDDGLNLVSFTIHCTLQFHELQEILAESCEL
jgi:hypothetical protein